MMQPGLMPCASSIACLSPPTGPTMTGTGCMQLWQQGHRAASSVMMRCGTMCSSCWHPATSTSGSSVIRCGQCLLLPFSPNLPLHATSEINTSSPGAEMLLASADGYPSILSSCWAALQKHDEHVDDPSYSASEVVWAFSNIKLLSAGQQPQHQHCKGLLSCLMTTCNLRHAASSGLYVIREVSLLLPASCWLLAMLGSKSLHSLCTAESTLCAAPFHEFLDGESIQRYMNHL